MINKVVCCLVEMKNDMTPIHRNSDERREWEGGNIPSNNYFYAPWNRQKKPAGKLVLVKKPNGQSVYKIHRS